MSRFRSGFRLGLGGGLGSGRSPFHPTQVLGFRYWLDSTVAPSFTIAPAAELLTNGDCEALGSWFASNAVLSLQPSGDGDQCIRATASAAGTFYVAQAVAVAGKAYREVGRVRLDGIATSPRVGMGGAAVWTGASGTTEWQDSSVTATASGTSVLWIGTASAAGEYIEINTCSVKLATDTNVSDWADKYGSRSVSQATANKQPLYVASGGPNNLPYVEFDGINELLKLTDATMVQPYTRIVLCQPTVSDDTTGTVYDGSNNTSGLLYVTAADFVSMFAGTQIQHVPSIEVSDWHVITCIFNGASSSIAVDLGTPKTGNAGASDPGGITLGARGGGTFPGDTRIVHAIEYSGVPSDSDLSMVKRYLLSRAGLI